MTCLRSEANMDSFMLGTLNPAANSWCLPFVQYYLDADGIPDPDKLGHIRHFIVYKNEFIFGPSEEYLAERYPEACYVTDPHTGEVTYTRPKKFTYIFFNIFDNPHGMRTNPTYLSELNNLPDHERDSQLYGNWYSVPKGSNYWQRDWLTKVDKIPSDGICARGWDKASQEPSDVEKHPDFTAGMAKIYKHRDGRYTIVGDFHEDNKCELNNKKIYGQFRRTPGARNKIIEAQALWDGEDCTVVLPVDPGAAGKTEYENHAADLLQAGIIAKKDPAPATKSKLLKFTNFAAACENGLVSICESSFKNKDTLDHFYLSLENFDGERSTRQKKDDIPDCIATTFNYLSERRVTKIVPRKQLRNETEASSLISERDGLLNEYLGEAPLFGDD